MVEKLYYSDPYMRQFDAKVVRTDGNRIFLDRTAFYPGGGGQQFDLGTIDDAQVERVGTEGDDIFHEIVKSQINIGKEVHCEIDWKRRFDLMRGHSGQHILFRALQEQNPELTVAKVDIAPEKKSLFVDGELLWDMLKRAVARANEIIEADLPIVRQEVSADSDELERVRVKRERLKGSRVSIIRIGDFDAAACGGVHVRRTGELEGISVSRKISGRQASDWEIQFELGLSAFQEASQLALTTLSIADFLGCPVENVRQTVKNLREENVRVSELLRSISEKQLDSLEPNMIGSISFYSSLFMGADRKILNERAAKLIENEGTVVLFCDVSEGAYLLLGCNDKLSLDCPALLKKGFDLLGGRGGGKKNFAMGGGDNKTRAKEAFEAVKKSVQDILESQISCA